MIHEWNECLGIIESIVDIKMKFNNKINEWTYLMHRYNWDIQEEKDEQNLIKQLLLLLYIISLKLKLSKTISKIFWN